MKHIMSSVLSSALVISILAAPALAVSPAQTVTLTPTPADSMVQKVEYLLPYPGILPDHPLYFLKALRDRILEFLIVDPLRKAEFYLLQADKRLNMGVFFNTKGVADKAAESAVIAEQFMERTVSGLVAFKNAGSVVPASLVERLEKATAKHVEVLEEMVANATASQLQILATTLEKVKSLQGEIGKLK